MPDLLNHRMHEFEVVPPPAAWETIAARLNDDEQYSTVTAKMSNYDVQPPADIWNNILPLLKEAKTTKSRAPLLKISRRVYRFAAAAILAGLFIGGWILLNKSNTNIEAAVKGSVPEQATVAQTDKTSAGTGSQNLQNDSFSRTLRQQPSPDLNMPAANNNYLLVAAPGGQLTKVSAKFANVIGYLNGAADAGEHIDKGMNESAVWKNRFREWRIKISQSGFIPSSVNFLDITSLKELVQETQ